MLTLVDAMGSETKLALDFSVVRIYKTLKNKQYN